LLADAEECRCILWFLDRQDRWIGGADGNELIAGSDRTVLNLRQVSADAGWSPYAPPKHYWIACQVDYRHQYVNDAAENPLENRFAISIAKTDPDTGIDLFVQAEDGVTAVGSRVVTIAGKEGALLFAFEGHPDADGSGYLRVAGHTNLYLALSPVRVGGKYVALLSDQKDDNARWSYRLPDEIWENYARTA
jgi:hypothetical protein